MNITFAYENLPGISEVPKEEIESYVKSVEQNVLPELEKIRFEKINCEDTALLKL